MAQPMLPNNYSARLDIERMFAAAQNIAADGQNSGKNLKKNSAYSRPKVQKSRDFLMCGVRNRNLEICS